MSTTLAWSLIGLAICFWIFVEMLAASKRWHEQHHPLQSAQLARDHEMQDRREGRL